MTSGGSAATPRRRGWRWTWSKRAFAEAPHPIRLHLDLGEELDEFDGPLHVAQRGPEQRDDLRDLRYGNDVDACDGAFGFKWERDARYCFARLGARGLAYRYGVFTDDLASFDAGGAAAGDALAIGVSDWGAPHLQAMAGGLSGCVTSTSAARACRRRCSCTSSGTRSASSTRAVSSRPTT